MKLPYEKPLVAVEDYVLSQTIAACNIKIGLMNSDCVYNDPDMLMYTDTRILAYGGFFLKPGGCLYYAENTDPKDGLCYHQQANAMFVS